MKKQTIILCCGKAGCPTLTKSDESDLLVLTDDFGGEVKLKEEELEKISDALIEFREKADVSDVKDS
tara:strand:- start:240 stop:440 length:201 start_codon:yes stop_codon:yes gene_type:complete